METMDLSELLASAASPDPRDAMDATEHQVCLDRRVNQECCHHQDPRANLVSRDAMDLRESPDVRESVA